MVDPKPQLSVNISPNGERMRIIFSQCSWVCLVLAAIVVGAVKSGLVWLAVLTGAIFMLPVLVWLFGQVKSFSGVFDDLYISAWGIASLFAMALGGGALSPLTGMLVLGPLACIMLGRLDISIHSAVLGLIAYAVAIIAGVSGWADTAPTGWQSLVPPFTIAALVQAVIFVWAIEPQLRGIQFASEHDANGEKEDTSPLKDYSGESENPVAPAQVPVVQAAGHNLPFVLLQIAPEGRILSVEGASHLQWSDLLPGKTADSVRDNIHNGQLVSPDGTPFQVYRDKTNQGGEWIGLIPVEVDTSKIDELTKALEETRFSLGETETALSDRTAFFAGLGHDLKTPLNAILGFADLMKAEVRGPLPEAYKDYPGIIHESGQDLMLLVDDILDLAKAEASGHRLDLEPIDLVASAASVKRQLTDQADRAGVKLSLKETDEVWAEADARAVRQIWQNLISNAIKYSDEGSTVTLSAGKSAGAVAISVRDKGAGMSKDDLDRIAKPFAQGANAKGRAGTGLGLAVVHRFAELHGGKVVIDTEKGKGTRVRVTLPALDMNRLESLEDAAQ